jgi:hypothetical protein
MISDRFNSVTLKLLLSGSSLFMLLTLIAIEWNVVASIVPGMTDGDVDANSTVWFLATFILACEMLGGMTAVAISDSIQMTVMGTSFLLLAVLMQYQYGGLSGSVPYHCDNYVATVTVNGTCPGHLTPVSCNEFYPEAFTGKPECTYCSVFGLHTSFGNKLGHLDSDEDPPNSIGALNVAEDHHSFCSACPTSAIENHTLQESGCVAHTNSWALTYPPRVTA